MAEFHVSRLALMGHMGRSVLEQIEALAEFTHTNASLRAAVTEYFQNKAACERRYGLIGTWNVSRVTDMSGLFAFRRDFNEDISAWDTSSVTGCAETRGQRPLHFEAG